MIPSLLQIPSAVSDSKLHSVLPNNGKGDFTFDRSTGATRINRDGLIEEVGYFSSELVQNGNFSELGSELTSQPVNLINDFNPNGSTTIIDADTFNSTGNTLDGIASKTGEFSLTVGKTYKIEIQGDTTSSGFTLGAGNGNGDEYGSGFGTHYFVSLHAQLWIRQRTTGVTNITSLSIKQVDPNDRWNLDTGWSIENGVAISSGLANKYLYQNIGITSSKIYKCTIEIKTLTSGQVDLQYFNGSFTNIGSNLTVGTNTLIFTASGSPNGSIYVRSASFVGTVDNISIVEVQGDRPRLSYDITNGVVEDTPHLLLEPSSTNLVTFSEDFSNSYWTKGGVTTVTANFASPDGQNNAYKLSGANGTDRTGNVLLRNFNTGNSTFSLYVKSLGSTKIRFYFRDGTTGAIVNSGSFSLTNEYQRLTFSHNVANLSNFYIGDTDGDVLIFGAQIEALTYATSYIPTAGTTITRAAETCLKTDLSNSIGQTEGVLFADVEILNVTGNEGLASINSGGYANHTTLNRVGNQIQYVRTSATQSGSLVVSSGTITAGRHKIAIKYKSGDSDCFLNGEKVGATQTQTFTNGTLNVFRIGADAIGSIPISGGIYGLALYTEALSESQLMQLTGVTASSIYSNFVTRTASFTVEALNEVKKVIDNL